MENLTTILIYSQMARLLSNLTSPALHHAVAAYTGFRKNLTAIKKDILSFEII